MALDNNSKIYLAGHNGLVGSAIWNNLKLRAYNNLVGRSHKKLDLTDQVAVKQFFDERNDKSNTIIVGLLPFPNNIKTKYNGNN